MASASKTPARSLRFTEPDVLPPYYVRRALGQLMSPRIIQQLVPSMFPSVPGWMKTLFWVLIFANIKSLPLLWHIRIFSVAIAARAVARPSIHPLLPWVHSNKHATTSPGITPRLRLDKLPLGRDIFADRSLTMYRALPDDCDWNGHMSNSCYPKNLDHTRMAFLASRFLRMHFDGGQFALGGASFIWHAEVPMMAKYEIEMSVGSWDDKWIYIIGRFLSPGKRSSSIRKSKSAQNLKALMSDVVKPQHEAERTRNTSDKAAGKTAARERNEERKASSERTLYCTSVSRYCFKSGRKTIPPWFIIATSGYGSYASTRTNWDKAENLRRRVLARCKAEYLEEKGKPLPRDSLVLGSGYRRGGILAKFDPSRPEGDSSHDVGLGAWQDRENWHLAEYEDRRVRGLEAIRTLGGLAASRADILESTQSLASLGSDAAF